MSEPTYRESHLADVIWQLAQRAAQSQYELRVKVLEDEIAELRDAITDLVHPRSAEWHLARALEVDGNDSFPHSLTNAIESYLSPEPQSLRA